MEFEQLSNRVIGCALEVHRTLGPGLLESTYEQCVEDALKRAKSEAGLSDYEVRTWTGWYHHQTLSLIAIWFLVLETLRGEKIHAGDHGSADSYSVALAVASSLLPQPSRLGNRLCKLQYGCS